MLRSKLDLSPSPTLHLPTQFREEGVFEQASVGLPCGWQVSRMIEADECLNPWLPGGELFYIYDIAARLKHYR